MLRRRFSFKELFPSADLNAIYKFYVQTRDVVGDSTNPYMQSIKAINLSIYRSMHIEYEKNIKPQLQNAARVAEIAEALERYGYKIQFPAEAPFCELRGVAADYEVTLTIKGYLERDQASAKRREDQSDFTRELRGLGLKPAELLRRNQELRQSAEAVDDRLMFKHGGYYLTPAQNEFYRTMMRERAREKQQEDECELFDFTPEFVDIVPIDVQLRNSETGVTLVAEGQIVDLLANERGHIQRSAVRDSHGIPRSLSRAVHSKLRRPFNAISKKLFARQQFLQSLCAGFIISASAWK